MRQLCLLMLSFLAAAFWSGGNAEAESGTREGFEWHDCPYAPDEDFAVRCGRLHIVEPGPASLPVAVIQQDPERPSESAVLYLEGGPGSSSGLDPDGFSYWPNWATGIGFEQDLVVFDQRGTGLADPSLDCPELREIVRPNLASGWLSESSVRRLAEVKTACHDRLLAEGHDLTQFTTAQLARDAIALMDVLPYAEWTILGASHGSRVALEVIRHRSEGVRSVILDGAVPPDIDLPLEVPDRLDASLARIDLACMWWRLDPQFCSQQAGTFFPSLDEILERLAESPHLTVVDDGADRPYKVRAQAAELVFALAGMSGFPDEAALARDAVVSAASGDLAMLDHIVRHWATAQISPDLHEPVLFSVSCNFDSRWTAEDFDRRAARSNYYRAYVPDHWYMHPCEHWTVSRADELTREPVSSTIPTLVLSGGYDTVTPAAWGERVAASLDHSYHFILPEAGHGTVFTDLCAMWILRGFLSDPLVEPDSGCLQDETPSATDPE